MMLSPTTYRSPPHHDERLARRLPGWVLRETGSVQTAAIVAVVVAVVCAPVGVFTVIRGQSFAGHRLR